MEQSKVCQHFMQNRAQSFVLNPPPKGFLHDRLVTCNRFIDDTLHSSSPLPENNEMSTSNIKHPIPTPSQNKKNHTLSPSVSKLLPNLLSIPKSVYRTVPSNQSTSHLLKPKKHTFIPCFPLHLAPQPLTNQFCGKVCTRTQCHCDVHRSFGTTKSWSFGASAAKWCQVGRSALSAISDDGWRCFILTPKNQGRQNQRRSEWYLHIVYMYNIDFWYVIVIIIIYYR